MQKPQIPIFMEITDAEWEEMVRLLCLREKKFKKNTIIFHQGDITEEMGIVIKGNVNIENVDISGNVSLLGNAEAGDVFAETYANFHHDFIKGKITVVGCPKLDDIDYSKKLTEIIQNNDIQSVTVVRMEVPCCGGLEHAAKTALQNSGKFIPWQVVTISTDGQILD
jgi:hypothetical protein